MISQGYVSIPITTMTFSDAWYENKAMTTGISKNNSVYIRVPWLFIQ